MCNHYRNDIRKTGREWEEWGFEEFSETNIRQNFPGLTEEIFPDAEALVARLNDKGRLVPDAMRWGFPPVERQVVTNVRNTASAYWRPWLQTQWRCLVPVTAFAEWSSGPPRGERWFAAVGGESLALAGIWRPWTGVRGPKARPVQGAHRLFAFLTCPPNALIKQYHPKAMPVVLPRADWDQWLTGSLEEALALQKPLPDNQLTLAA